MSVLEVWELLSYVVTVIALPLAIYTFWREQRKERENEEEEPCRGSIQEEYHEGREDDEGTRDTLDLFHELPVYTP